MVYTNFRTLRLFLLLAFLSGGILQGAQTAPVATQSPDKHDAHDVDELGFESQDWFIAGQVTVASLTGLSGFCIMQWNKSIKKIKQEQHALYQEIEGELGSVYAARSGQPGTLEGDFLLRRISRAENFAQILDGLIDRVLIFQQLLSSSLLGKNIKKKIDSYLEKERQIENYRSNKRYILRFVGAMLGLDALYCARKYELF